MRRRPGRVLLIPAALVGAAAIVLGIYLVERYRNRAPEPVTLSVDTEEQARSAIGAVVTEYNAQSKKYTAALLAGVNGEADLVLGPYRDGAVAWRSIGWRLWARLESLAALEGDLRRPLILPLREGRVDAAAFESMLEDLRRAGAVPLVMPRSPSPYSWAIAQYFSRLGGQAPIQTDDWEKKGWLVEVPDLRAAIDALRKNRAIFLLGSDATGGFLGRSADSHPEGFPLPGSRSSEAPWVLGRGYGFIIPQSAAQKAGALDLLIYLSSRGIARRFSQSLPGDFYSWTTAPAPGKLPDVHGPKVFLDQEPQAGK